MTSPALPTFDAALEIIAEAEQAEGWLVRCDEAACYLLACRELVDALAATLRGLEGPAIEVGSGNGELASWLNSAGVVLRATDPAPAGIAPLERLTAQEALARYGPATVLAAFAPYDSGVDEQVLNGPSVQHYLVLGARLGGLLGSAALWRQPGWTARRLNEVDRWMLTRHDVWLGRADRPILQHGEAWLFTRNA